MPVHRTRRHVRPSWGRRVTFQAWPVAVVVVVLLVFVTAGWLGLGAAQPPDSDARRIDQSDGGHQERPGPVSVGESGVGLRGSRDAMPWADVLARLDRRRDRAWREGNPAALDRVFRVGSRPLYADRVALRAYLERGYAVDGAHLHFGDPDVVALTVDAVRLRVTDRLSPVSVTGADGAATPLPVDHPTQHVITLTRTSVGWRITDIRAS